MFRILVCEINRFGDSIIRTNSVSSSASGPPNGSPSLVSGRNSWAIPFRILNAK